MGRRVVGVSGPLVLIALALGIANCSALDDEETSSSPEVHSPIPVLTPPPGWVLGSNHNNAPVVLEVFLDLVCPDSARAWHMLHQLREDHSDEDLKIIVHTYELPYHRNAYTISQGYHLVKAERPEYLETYVDVVYGHLSSFKDSNSSHLSNDDVIELLSNIVTHEEIMDKEEFKSKIGDYYRDVLRHWKYAARRGVAGTPWYFVNGIDMALDPNLTYDIHSWSRFMQRTLRSPGRPQKDVRNSNGVYNPALGRAYFLLTTHITIGLLSISFHILCL